MNIKKLTLSLIAMLGVGAFWAISAYATTWYVRDGGGAYGLTSTTCNGQSNAIFTGSNGPNCAVNNPGYILGWGCVLSNNSDCDSGVPVMAGGDTLYIDGDSDTSPGNQAQYEIGYNASTPGLFNNGLYGHCVAAATYTCGMGEIPAGTLSLQTSVIGTGTHKPQLWGTQRIATVLQADNNYITLQWLEITDHTACAYLDPTQGCNYSSSPYGPVAEAGLSITGTGFNITDVYIHGLGTTGVNTGNLGSATFTRLWVIGNGYAGFTTGTSATVSGTLTFNQPIIDWNGCVEQYPMTYPGIENSGNYLNCFGQNSGGYGDGLAFGNATSGTSGNWTIIGPGSISFNTQDGLDLLHGLGDNGTIQIDKMRFEGNAGQQLKITGVVDNVTNNIIIGDCGWWLGAPQTLSGGMQNGDSCRANGSTILFDVTKSGTYNFYNNTIITNSIALETSDDPNTGCNGNTAFKVYNNIILGGVGWSYNTGINSNGGNELDTFYYNDGYQGGGSCSTLAANEDYNNVSGMKNGNPQCLGGHDKCGVSPGFSSGTFPNGTAGGGQSSYYTGQAGASLVALSIGSPAVAAGVGGLTYWNNSNDYHNVTRTNPPSIGGLEENSCAVTSYGCFLNSDCCTSLSCSNFMCGESSGAPQPIVTITNPQNGSSFPNGSNLTITVTASETNGTISTISLYNGVGVLLGGSNTSPYNYVATDLAAGAYTYTATATDIYGVSTTSNPITIIVTPVSLPSLPVVSISSLGGNTFLAGSNVTLAATASEINGTIAKISIYNGAGVLLGSGGSSPYDYVASDLLAGTYTYTAQATDAIGVSMISSPIIVTVTSSPSPVVAITSPVNGGSFIPGSLIIITAAASEANGTISKVAFYNGSSLLGTVTNSPYRLTWVNVPLGTHNLTAIATDSNGSSTTSTSVNVNVTSSTSSPVVAITSPSNGSTFTAGSNVSITATASETNGTISKVAFYNGSTLLGTATSSPYSYTWSNVAAGSYSLTAIATDANSISVTSSPIAVTILAPASPVVSITSPSNGSAFTAGSNVSITATASEASGTISKVMFYNGTTLLGTATSSPYSYTWSNVAAGSYSLTAIATDAHGVSITSSPIAVTISAPASPVVAITSPLNGSFFTVGSNITIAASALETNGTISKVMFYNGSTLLGTATSSPYGYTWSNVAAGNYSLTAVAYDNNGHTTTSAAVAVAVSGLPVVSLSSNNTSFTAPASIVLTAAASETNGSISKVMFYNGPTLLGTATSSPYGYTWNNVAAGNYSLTAVAYDNNGRTTISTAVAVEVSGLPVVNLSSNNTSFTAPASIVLTAAASEVNGTISKVMFYNGSTLLGTVTSSPYVFTWSNVTAGTYNLTSVATDSAGVTATSSVVSDTVNSQAQVGGLTVSLTSPVNNASYTAPTTIILGASVSDSGATVTKIDYYNGNSYVGTTYTSPYRLIWINVQAGTYSLTAKATDSNGLSKSSPAATITVKS